MNGSIILKRKEEFRLLKGHLWVFSNEIFSVEGGPENGEIVNIYDSRNKLLGSGFFNKNSLISVRVLSDSPIQDLYALFRKRIRNAIEYRRSIYTERDSYRLVFGESDLLPGLIIDKFNNTFVLQINSFGMQKNVSLIVDILKTELEARNIFSKNEVNFRTLEGLPAEDEIYLGEKGEEIINDGKIKFKIDFNQSQKTGLFLDQSDNRFFIEKFVNDKSVLDGFCNSGGFGLHALSGGATGVDFVDSSLNEVKSAETNYKMNGFEAESNFIQSDMFEFLDNAISNGKKYDLVMIDPPAFIKGKKSIHTGIKGYEKLNRLALSTVEKNGYFITSSCSHHLMRDIFLDVINSAAEKCNKKLIKVYENGSSLDHPVHPAMPETAYLKFFVFRLVE